MLSFTLCPNSVTRINTGWMACLVQACYVTDAVPSVAALAILCLIKVKFDYFPFGSISSPCTLTATHILAMTGISPDFVDEPKRLSISRKPPNSCLRRQSDLSYKLVNPLSPNSEDALYYDMGQLKQILLMDRRLREEGVVRSIPAGYREFATRFNAFAEGPERFATYQFIKGQYTITTSGSPITWECLALDDPLPESSNTNWFHGAAEQERDGFMPAFGFMDGSTNTQLHALSTYMRGVMNTTDELTRFWIKRYSFLHSSHDQVLTVSP